MLHNFISHNRDLITERTGVLGRSRRRQQHVEPPNEAISDFLTQLSTSLRQGPSCIARNVAAIGETAGRNGSEMMRSGLAVGDVVQTYGDVCQAIAEVAAETHVSISASDYKLFNRCLDDAIEHAVSEYVRISDEARSRAEVRRLGYAAHELRDQLHTAQLAFEVLKRSGQGVDSEPGRLLTGALANLSQLIDRTLANVRLAARIARDHVLVGALVDEVARTAQLHADHRNVRLSIDLEGDGVVDADPQLLMSAVMNLIHNALKFTVAGGQVRLVVRASSPRLTISVEDQCGGIPDGGTHIFRTFADRHGADRSGLGLGLSLARNIVRAHDGDIKVRNVPGSGCVFTIEMPIARAHG